MKNRSTDHQEWLVQELADPELAAEYLTAALEDSPEMFLEAVKNVAQAKHKISELAKQAGITRESMYRSFSSDGNPAFKTFYKLLDILDIEIEFKAKAKEKFESPIAPVSVHESDALGAPIAANPNQSLAAYLDESGREIHGQQGLYIGPTDINVANPKSEYDIDDETMGIISSMPAMAWQQQQLMESEKINA